MELGDRQKLFEEASKIDNGKLPQYWFIFESNEIASWMNDFIYFHPYFCFQIGVCYLSINWILKHGMEIRKPFKMTCLAACWYLCMLVLNFLVITRIVSHVLHAVITEGIYYSACQDITILLDTVSYFWTAFFSYLKILELGDTFVMYLQKRRVSFYIWCHHTTAMIGSWYMYRCYPVTGIWFVLIISLPHIPLYLYSFLRELTLISPNPIYGHTILLTEIISLTIGMLVGIITYYYISIGVQCKTSLSVALVAAILFCICLILCVIFFILRLKGIKSNAKEAGDGSCKQEEVKSYV